MCPAGAIVFLKGILGDLEETRGTEFLTVCTGCYHRYSYLVIPHSTGSWVQNGPRQPGQLVPGHTVTWAELLLRSWATATNKSSYSVLSSFTLLLGCVG